MTRKEDILLYDRTQSYEGRKKALDMQARLNIAAKHENAIFVSIHQNSYPVEKYSGFQVYYSQNNAESAILARTLENAVREKLQPSNNRASKNAGDSIYLLKHLSCPAVLLECGFISNMEECKALSSEEYQKRLTEVLCDAIVEFINNRQTV
jgi:N-acetylmuramoyl-L-alanine amidase